MKKFGWFVYNSYFLSQSTLDLVEQFKIVFLAHDCELTVLKSNELLFYYDSDGEVKQSTNFNKPDFVLFWDKDINLARMLEKWGVKVYNTSSSIEICDDKVLTYNALAKHNIPLIKTVFSPLIYSTCVETDNTFLTNLLNLLNFPIVVKESKGSFGQQVYLANNINELIELRKKLLYRPHLYQEFISSSSGTDIRLAIIDRKLVACMKRTNKSDFRANVELGGTCEKFEPTQEMIDLAIKVVDIIGLKYAGVDILLDNGVYKVCEVNSNAYVKGITQCTNVNVVEEYVRSILK